MDGVCFKALVNIKMKTDEQVQPLKRQHLLVFCDIKLNVWNCCSDNVGGKDCHFNQENNW